MRRDKTSERETNKVILFKVRNAENKDNQNNQNIERKKISTKMKILLSLIIAFLLLCLIVSVVIFIFLRNVKKDKDTNPKLGYFLPSDDKNNYYKCSLPNCKECQGTINDNVCLTCMDNSIPVFGDNNSIISCKKDKSNQGRCQIGKEEKCLTCDYSKAECSTCNNGYFMPEDETTKTKCQKCSIKNCGKCSGNKSSDTCTLCEDYSSPIYQNDKIQKCIIEIGEGPKCLTVDTEENECRSCNLGYKYENGKCILDHHFKASFISNSENEKIKIAEQILPFIQEMIVDGVKLSSPVKEYTFQKKGEHIIYYKIKNSNSFTMVGMFEGLKKMTSISFTKLFNIKNNQKMDRMFYNCQKLTSIDFSNINTDNVVSMNYLFYQCLSLTSIDLSKINTALVEDASFMFTNCISLKNINLNNFKTDKVEDMSNIFKGCSSLTSIDLSNFNTEQVKDVSEMFNGCSSLTSIDISNFYLPKVETLDYMFKDCSNLQYINMALLNNKLMGTFDGIPSSGKIVTNNNLKTEISNALKGWTINIE